MDPNEALRELRVALAVLMPRRARLIALAKDDYKRDELDDLIDSAAALDAWLSKGGWLPDAWETGETNCFQLVRPVDSKPSAEPDPFPSSPRLEP